MSELKKVPNIKPRENLYDKKKLAVYDKKRVAVYDKKKLAVWLMNQRFFVLNYVI